MAKDNYLKFRCTDKMKSIVESKAKENNMSVTAYLEYLIRRDVDIMRIVMSDNLTEDIENRLKEEELEEVFLTMEGIFEKKKNKLLPSKRKYPYKCLIY